MTENRTDRDVAGNSMFMGLGVSLLILAGVIFLAIGVHDLQYKEPYAWVASRLEVLIGLLFLVSPFFVWAKMAILVRFPEAMREANRSMATLESLRMENMKFRTFMEQFQESLLKAMEEGFGGLSEAARHVARLNSDLNVQMELRQELGTAKRLQETWVNSLVRFLQNIETTLSHPELQPEIRSSYERVLTSCCSAMKGVGLQVIRPAKGEAFDDSCQIIVDQAPSSEVEPDHILECKVWGFRLGAEVLKKAEVALAMECAAAAEGCEAGEPQCACAEAEPSEEVESATSSAKGSAE